MTLESRLGAFLKKVGPDNDGAFALAFMSGDMAGYCGSPLLSAAFYIAGVTMFAATCDYSLGVVKKYLDVIVEEDSA